MNASLNEKLGTVKWGKFKYKEVFNRIEQGRRLKKDDQIDGTIPFVMSGTTNAGVVNYISNPVASFPKNAITIDIFGNTFYRNYAFGAGDDTGVYWNDATAYLKKTEKEKIETTASVATESLNRSQQRSNSNAIRAKIKEAVAASGKQYDGIKEIIDMVRQIIPYNRMLISSDGYLIPLDDRYFRIDAQNLGFKYGGEITCVGMITNIIGEDTDPNDSQNIFATLQFSVNEVLRQLLPTKERNLCVIHPIAVYYGN